MSTILSNLDNFHPLEVVTRVSETQLQVGEIIWAIYGLNNALSMNSIHCKQWGVLVLK